MSKYLTNKFLYLLALAYVLPLRALAATGVEIKDPMNLGDEPVPALANRLIETAIGLAGVLALIAFIYGGILYMLAGVDAKNVDKGKAMMRNAVIGLIIIFSSYAIVTFILKNVLQIK